ncbi:MAG TPA: cellulose-binding protein [Cyanobacteria bacterium UBA11149]|nr:cellulose-binding protein [Cyanobacteria bacterium UBA11367]HBE57012.1 cellulose-binding protein [Cyanobacteria bacterium UBA11366]HBK66739.1 cellulose-binding protein [Cyanobacteria bacterium UBA11166]HBR73058.1 cellulose-binding protein [Cyanobacteria bacterium UBA11159]HBS72727.1 cellulose-binding protein [Cyanobacteria bacterium UBA11153]HBW88849.1 cellulose-binding protein [Cyanobacteria bacterium UBA11149]HCA97012.1 cellulose-binding protein [Cyanobacteria bacterium UBA9226]
MKFLQLAILFIATLGLAIIAPNLINNSNPNPISPSGHVFLGTNLTGIADWSTEMPFLDAFKSSRKWITQCNAKESGCSGTWDTNEFDKLNLDKNGWVKSLPKPEESPEYTRVGTLMFRDVESYPGGQYVVLYDGEGKIEYKYDAVKDEAASKSGRDVINVTPSNAGIYLLITATDPNKTGNYIRNIHVVQAQYETTYKSQIFNPKFIGKISKFKALRFMDWMATNGSQQQEWQNRPKVEDASYSWKGVPAEILVEIANRLNLDAWFNMPHIATDEYITNFAKIVKDTLKPNLKAYVEFSNEVWNPQFQQYHYALQEGKARWGENKADAYMQWYGMRAAQMCDIWEHTFGNQNHRLSCVISTQTAWKGLEKSVLDCPYWVDEGHKPCYQHGIDVYAITGYFGASLGKPNNFSTVESWLKESERGFAKALTALKGKVSLGDNLIDTYNNFIYHAKVAKEKALQLVAYEGGQHIVGSQGLENNDTLTNFFINLNRRPEMYDLYTQLLNDWQKAGGTLFMNYSDIVKPSKWGSWGALENVNQNTSPKYKALMDFIAANH